MTIINIFSERIKREMPEINALLVAYGAAVRNIEDWEAEAAALWAEVSSKIEVLVAQAVRDEPDAADKVARWAKDAGVDISTHVDKVQRHLPKVIAESIVSMMVGFATTLTAAIEAEEDAAAEGSPEPTGPRAV